ncbi:MAG TPA: hypothetical protein VMU88_07215 [bacterium]|nr:hypothetical protein [bacterium]
MRHHKGGVTVLGFFLAALGLASCSPQKLPEAGLGTVNAVQTPTPTPLPSDPTTLSAGDLALLGFTTKGTENDQFAFVILKNVGGGTRVNLSDMNWDGHAFATTDGGVIVWAADRDYPAGTVVQVLPTSNGSSSSTHSYAVNIYSAGVTYTNVTGAGAQTGTYAFDPASPIQVSTVANTGGGLTGLAKEGDQLIAYQGSAALGAPASGVTFLGGLNYGGAWLTGTPTPVNFSEAQGESYLPPGLVDGQDAMAIPSGYGNGGYYNCVNGSAGTAPQLGALINDPSNWTLSMPSNDLPIPVCRVFQVQ